MKQREGRQADEASWEGGRKEEVEAEVAASPSYEREIELRAKVAKE